MPDTSINLFSLSVFLLASQGFESGFDSRRELRALVGRGHGRPPEVRSVPRLLRVPYGAPQKKPLLSTKAREVFSCFYGQNKSKTSENISKQGLDRLIRPPQPLFLICSIKIAHYFLCFFALLRSWKTCTLRDLNHKNTKNP